MESGWYVEFEGRKCDLDVWRRELSDKNDAFVITETTPSSKEIFYISNFDLLNQKYSKKFNENSHVFTKAKAFFGLTNVRMATRFGTLPVSLTV